MIVCVLGNDARQLNVARLFKQKNYMVFEEKDCVKDKDLISSADIIILPLPYSRDGKNIFSSLFTVKQVATLANKDCVVFAGMCKNVFYNEYDYNTDEEFLKNNAFYTAEGAISIAIEKTDYSLSEANVLIVGNGRIGKCIAMLLKNFGAKITVSARKKQDFSYIENHSYLAIHTNLATDLSQYDIIFNTVPENALCFGAKQTIRSNAIIIDLASKNSELYRDQNYIDAKSLPAKYCAVSSAKAVCNSVKKHKGENLI